MQKFDVGESLEEILKFYNGTKLISLVGSNCGAGSVKPPVLDNVADGLIMPALPI